MQRTGKYDYITYWKDIAAFISVIPRQSGKTTMISKLVNKFKKEQENYIIVLPTINMKKTMMRNFNFDVNKTYAISEIQGIKPADCNLLVDEFTYIDYTNMCYMLDHNWKTVTMIGTLR